MYAPKTTRRLSRTEIADILELKNEESLGELLEALIESYSIAGHKGFLSKTTLPDFLQADFGPALDRLPSYARKTDKEEHPELVAPRRQGRGIDGLGEIMDVIHADMRQVGGNLGRVFAQSVKEHIPPGNTVGNKFQPRQVEKLKGKNTAIAYLGHDKTPLPITSPDILYQIFLMGAEARAHLTRSSAERKMLEESVGVLRESYDSLNNLLRIVQCHMEYNPDFKGKTMADFGLAINTDKAATAFHLRQQQFSDAYNYIYISHEGHLDPKLQNLKWAIEQRRPPARGITIRNGHEAAAALAGLYDIMFEEKPPGSVAFMNMLATKSPVGAALALQQSHCLEELHMAAVDLGTTGLFAEKILAELEDFRDIASPPFARRMSQLRTSAQEARMR